MRRWQLGLVPLKPPVCGGRPFSLWMQLFLLSHAQEGVHWRRLPWPDGRATGDQAWPCVTIFRIVADELAHIAAEAAARRRMRQRGPGVPGEPGALGEPAAMASPYPEEP